MAKYVEINPNVFSVIRTIDKMRRHNDPPAEIEKFRSENASVLKSCQILDYIQTDFIMKFRPEAATWCLRACIPLGVGQEWNGECVYVLVAGKRGGGRPSSAVSGKFGSLAGRQTSSGGDEVAVSPAMESDIRALLGDSIAGRSLVCICASQDVVDVALDEFFFKSAMDDVVEAAAATVADEGGFTVINAVDTPDLDSRSVQLCQGWLRKAINLGVSDIHIEPTETGGRVRFRIDGDLREEDRHIDRRTMQQVVSWLKVQADVNITEQRKPLDGKMKLLRSVKGSRHEVDVRFSSIPTVFGEKVVLRLLDKSRSEEQFAGRGLRSVFPNDADGERIYEVFNDALAGGNGIVLVTGPTGCGKSTTLTTSLRDLLRRYGSRKNIVTVEDPVEYTVPGASQVQTNELAGLTFASALRSILRQDPDIVLVGEIRDEETAQIAVQAALTGHLILSTLHTNDAIGCVERLQDLHVSPFLIGSTVRIFQAQRLVKVLCPGANPPPGVVGCSKLLSEEETMERVLAGPLARYARRFDGKTMRMGNIQGGCARCQNQGYKGRRAVMEVIPMRNALRAAIQRGETRDTLVETAQKYCGYRSMIECGVDLILGGVTDIVQIEELDNGDV